VFRHHQLAPVARNREQHHTAIFEFLWCKAGQDVGLQERSQIGGQDARADGRRHGWAFNSLHTLPRTVTIVLVYKDFLGQKLLLTPAEIKTRQPR
jgi:hypothetical protein